MKSMKQIADDLGIEKQKVYRFIRDNKIQESDKNGATLLYDESVIKLIKQRFHQDTTSAEVNYKHINESINRAFSMVELLGDELKIKNKELEIKNEQIKKLNETLDKTMAML